jgi:hypothetical protein
MEEHREVICLLPDHPRVDWIHQGAWEHGHPAGHLWQAGYRQEGKTGRREVHTLAWGLLWAVRWVLGRLSRGHLALDYLSEGRLELWEQGCFVGGTLSRDRREGCSV